MRHVITILEEFVLNPKSANFLWKGPKCKYCWEPRDRNRSTLPLQHESSDRGRLSQRAWRLANKTLFTKTGVGGQGLTPVLKTLTTYKLTSERERERVRVGMAAPTGTLWIGTSLCSHVLLQLTSPHVSGVHSTACLAFSSGEGV